MKKFLISFTLTQEEKKRILPWCNHYLATAFCDICLQKMDICAFYFHSGLLFFVLFYFVFGKNKSNRKVMWLVQQEGRRKNSSQPNVSSRRVANIDNGSFEFQSPSTHKRAGWQQWLSRMLRASKALPLLLGNPEALRVAQGMESWQLVQGPPWGFSYPGEILLRSNQPLQNSFLCLWGNCVTQNCDFVLSSSWS